MPVAGAKPKPEGTAVTRHPKVHDWIEVENTPYTGPVPVRLPTKTTMVSSEGIIIYLKIHRLTRAWWRTVSRMPHCQLWEDQDWQFALATALIADRFYHGGLQVAGELRQREKILGLTLDARRDLRIRYVDPKPDKSEGDGASVTRLADYRSL